MTENTENPIDQPLAATESSDAALPTPGDVEEPREPAAEVAEPESEAVAEPVVEEAEMAGAEVEEESDTGAKDWYILKVQSNREDSIAEALRRRVKIEGLEPFFDEIIVPTEKVTEFNKNGKKRIVKRKLYPGYIMVHMSINDDTWFLVRETPGIGDFTGAGGKPVPMLAHEVERIIGKEEVPGEEVTKINIPYQQGSRVKIIEGTFENFEGDVDAIDETNGRVTVMINIFGRSTPVELEHWQVEPL